MGSGVKKTGRAFLFDLKKYCVGVREEKIPACQKHRWACERFERDLKRAGTSGFPYRFDVERAMDFFNFTGFFKHTKGVLAGRKIEPAPIHKFIFGNIYGWYHVGTGHRRFKKLYWQVARKQGKSQWMALVLLYECFVFGKSETQNTVNECFCFATKRDQAKVVWDEAKLMLMRSALPKWKYRIAYGRIEHVKSGSFIRTLSEEDKRTGDGLNPQCGSNDEYHAQETAEIYDIIDSGMGARPEPLLCTITTAGFDLNSPCYRVEYDLCSKILNPSVELNLDSYFVMINELDKNNFYDTIKVNGREIPPGGLIDDITDESVWPKSNPVNCSYPEGLEYLRIKLAEAREMPEKMRNFLTKHMNVWVNQREAGYMDMARWMLCGEPDSDKLPDVGKGFRYTPFCGVDLSSTIDLTSVVFVINISDGIQYVKHHSFMPQETIDRRSKQDNVRYDLWVSQGWITATAGAEVDYHHVLQWITDQYIKYKWGKGEVAFDKYLATWLEHELDVKGFTPVEISQSYTGLSLATKALRAKVYDKKIIHEDDPVLNWAMSNAVIRCGPSENIMLDKSAARFRIDPVAALINAMTRALVNEPQGNPTVLFV